ncbi:MAG: DMT family transporter [Pseudomonadota bacterium]
MSVPLAYLTVIAIWATTPLAIKWSALGTGFAFAVLARMAIGVVLAVLILALWRVELPMHGKARRTYLAGGLGLFGAMILTYWGAQFITSGLVSVLFGLAPLVTSLLAALWLGERALAPAKLAGMLLGLAGLGLVFLAEQGVGGAHALAGMAALLLAVFIYSASLVWIKRIGDDSPPLAITAGTLAVSLPLFLLVWLWVDGNVPAQVPLVAGGAIVYLGVFGSVLGFSLYYYIVRHVDTGRVALITLITPVLALLLGILLNGETVPLRVWLGAGLIVLGLSIYQGSALAGMLAPGRK